MKTTSILSFLLTISLAAQLQAADSPPAPAVQKGEGLDAQTLYEFLVGEIAGQRGDLVLSLEAYTDLARKTRDPRVVRRAAEIAMYGRNLAKAVEMSKLWVELEPDSIQARRFLIGTLVASGRLAEAKPSLEAVLHAKDVSPAETLIQMQGFLSRCPDKAAALKLIQGLAAGYPDLPEAHQAVAQSALAAGQFDVALTEADTMLKLTPTSEVAALLKGEALLGKQGDAAELAYLQEFLATHADASRVRLVYAKRLTKANRFEEARKQFELLAQASPESPDAYLAIGLLDMQMNDLDGAEEAFKRALALKYQDEGLVKLYLGQVEEARQHYDQALAWYEQVEGGEQALQAQLKSALVLAKLNRVDEGVARLKQLEEKRPEDRVRIIQTEAQLLRDAKRYRDAYDLLSKALEKTPDAGELLYDRAMTAEKLDLLKAMETDLRQLIKLQPDSAQAYNALGYTLVDRTSRIAEGIDLLDKALKLSPDDPFILDSMGWGQYRAGHLDKAEDYLRRAYKGKADPEIAAHLGEVLWQRNTRDEAIQIWRDALKASPDNEALRQTMSRFGQ
jgi:tetratricopeptide (TPR) repeat protein